MWSGSQYCEVLVLLTQSMKPENYFSVEMVQVRTNSCSPGQRDTRPLSAAGTGLGLQGMGHWTGKANILIRISQHSHAQLELAGSKTNSCSKFG